MSLEDDLPTDEEELIELARRIIEVMTDNPNYPNPPVPMAEFQKTLDNFIKLREAEAAAWEAEKRAREEVEAAWEDVRSAQQSIRAYNRKYGIRDNSTNLLASGMPGLANRVFSQLGDQEDVLQIQKKEND